MRAAPLALGLTFALLPSLASAQQRVSIEELERQLRLAEDAQELERSRLAEQSRLGGMDDLGSEILWDPKTKLLWTRADNGTEADSSVARDWCAARQMRLPTIDELAEIYARPGSEATSCQIYSRSYMCEVSPLFRLTGVRYWSDTEQGPAGHWLIDLRDGARNTEGSVHADRGYRMLCVADTGDSSRETLVDLAIELRRLAGEADERIRREREEEEEAERKAEREWRDQLRETRRQSQN